jgi:hypothetical protein
LPEANPTTSTITTNTTRRCRYMVS